MNNAAIQIPPTPVRRPGVRRCGRAVGLGLVALAALAGAGLLAWRMAESRDDAGNAPAAETLPAPADLDELDPLARRRIEEAIERCRAAPGDPGAVAELGRTYHGNGRLDLAARCYELAGAAGTEDPAVPYLLGLIHEERGRTAPAVAAFGASLEGDPGYVPAHLHLGRVLLDAGRADEAAAAFRRGLEIDPSRVELHAGLGAALRQAGRLEDARAALDRALSIEPGNRGAHQLLGLTLMALGEPEEARLHLERPGDGTHEAMDDPRLRDVQSRAASLPAQLDLVEAFLQTDRATSAVAVLRRLEREHGDDPRIHRFLGEALLRAGDGQGAVNALVRATTLDPGDAAARTLLASILLDHGNLDDAALEAGRVLQRDPRHWHAMIVIAGVRVKQRRPAEAIPLLRTVIANRPDLPNAHVWMGDALLASGAPREAAEAYEAALRLRPDLEYARRRQLEAMARFPVPEPVRREAR